MSTVQGEKQRLLIVDDSKVIRVTARKILQDHFATVEAVDGENAWEILNNEDPFALIVSDLTMPNLDGFGLLERIRNSPQPHINSTPVIIITGANDCATTKERATRAGATDFIGKPFDSVHLLARTQAHANTQTITRALADETIALEDQALVDTLTGLANEMAYMDRGYEQLSYAVRHSTNLAVFRIEIDNFGLLYKEHGKEASESVIKSVATVLQSDVRNEDLAARIGAARFALLLPDMGRTGVYNLAQRLSKDISTRLLRLGEDSVRSTVSIGVAAPDIRRDTRFEELLSSADSCLAKAISRGGNQVVFADIDEPDQPPVATQPDKREQQPEVIEAVSTEKILEQTETVAEALSVPDMSELQLDEIDIAITEENPDLAVATIEVAITEESLGLAVAAAGEQAVTASRESALPQSHAGVSAVSAAAAATTTSEAVIHTTHSSGDEPAQLSSDAPNDILATGGADETIVITAPFDIDAPFEDQPAAVEPPVAAAAETRGLSEPTAPAEPLQIPVIEIGETAHTGVFKRIFTGFMSLFSRSG